MVQYSLAPSSSSRPWLGAAPASTSMLMAPSLLLLLCVPAATRPWTGPAVRVAFRGGVPSVLIDGVPTPPQFFMLGNPPSVMNFSTWDAEISAAREAGVRVFFVCNGGDDTGLLPAGPVLSRHTRAMVDYVLRLVPNALLIPHTTMTTGAARYGNTSVVGVPLNGSARVPMPWETMGTAWGAVAGARMAALLRLMDAAWPGRIAGVHLDGYSAENFFSPVQTGNLPGRNVFQDYSEYMRGAFCAGRKGPKPCELPSPLERLMPRRDSSVFATNASAALNLLLARRVQEGIAAVAKAVKLATQGKALVMTYYGYLTELQQFLPGSSHIALHAMLQDPNMDAICSPYKYDHYARSPTGPFLPMGPWDSARLHNKLWVTEDDTRTSLATDPGAQGLRSCKDSWCDVQLMRRNILSSVLHGSGLYQLDLGGIGWFGKNGSDAAATRALWDAVRESRQVAQHLFDAAVDAAEDGTKAVGGLEPEIAIFLDDESMAHLVIADRAPDAVPQLVTSPAQWLNVLPRDLANFGAPVRQYHVRDLLRPGFMAQHLAPIKLAVLPNAFKVDSNMSAALKSLGSSYRTLVYYYAPGHLSGNGDCEPAAANRRISELIGCPMERGDGAAPLTTVIVPHLAVPGFSGLRTLTGLVYGTEHVIPHSIAKSQAYAPWYHLSEHVAATPGNGTCTVLGRSSSSGKASLVLAERADHRVVFSAAPLPSQALRVLAAAAGVHMFLDGENGVEASGKGLLLRGGVNASLVGAHQVALPPRQGGWTVRNASGTLVCSACEAFDTSLQDGETQFWFVD